MDPQHVRMKSEIPYSMPTEDILYNATAAAAAAGMMGLMGGGAGGQSVAPGIGGLIPTGAEALIKTEPSDDNDDLTEDGTGVMPQGATITDPYLDDPASAGKQVSSTH